MRILLTEVTGRLGRAVAQDLLAAGHEVIGIADQPHPDLNAGVDFVAAPLRHPVLYDLAAEAEVVLQLPAAGAIARPADVVRVSDAVARSGARIIFPSFSLLEPSGWEQAEQLVATGWAPNLIVRLAAPVGRQIDGTVCRTIATLFHRDGAESVRVLHRDDLIRFLVTAVDTPHTGIVDLGTSGMVSVDRARRLLTSVDPRPRTRGMPQWSGLPVDLNVVALHDNWQFECAWGANAALADTARGLAGRKLGSDGATPLPGRFPMPVGVAGRRIGRAAAALPVGLGEFDDPIDPRYPLFVAARFNDAHSAPLSPMSLDLQVAGLRNAGRALSTFLGLNPEVAQEWDERLAVGQGHHIYFNASALEAAQQQLSRRGMDLTSQLWPAVHSEMVVRSPMHRSPAGAGLLHSAAGTVKAARIHAAEKVFGHQVEMYMDAASDERLGPDALGALSDPQIGARIRLLRDRIHEGWTLWAASLLLAESTPGWLAGRIGTEIAGLVTVIRAHPYVQTMIAAGDVAGAQTAAPMFASALDNAVSRIGHRGPGEIELGTKVFADCPDAILEAARGALLAGVGTTVSNGPADEQHRSYDALIAFIHQLRCAIRELAHRYVDARLLDAPDDIFYLTIDEALAMPFDTRLRIRRRTAECLRLQTVRLEPVIDGRPVPCPVVATAAPGSTMAGRGVRHGVVDGRIRVVRSAQDAHLTAIDVAVLAASDTDYLVLLGTPGAVIVEGDDEIADCTSVPAVVRISGASQQFVDGMRVRVDGTSGVVTVLADEVELDPDPLPSLREELTAAR